MTVPRLLFLIPVWLALVPGAGVARPQDPQKAEEQQPETFFAGTVVEWSTQKVIVSRVVLGKIEKRVFRVTPDTKCEGKVKAKVRVTVRYVTTEDGDVAELIVVRDQRRK